MSSVNTDSRTLYELLRSCKLGEAGAIVGGHIDRNELRDGLYVSTQEDEKLNSFFVDEYTEDGKLLIITGSAGDGKSALLSRAFRRAQSEGIDSLTEDQIHMDATASTRKTETYDQTLDRFFDRVVSNIRTGKGPRAGVAINLGLAIDFFERQGYGTKYEDLWKSIERAKPRLQLDNGPIQVLNLGHRKLFETHPDHFGDGLLRKIVDRFDGENPESPFHEAYKVEKKGCPAGTDCPLHYNMEQFSKAEVRSSIARLLAAKSLVENSYLNPRRILNYLASILLPNELEEIATSDSVCPVGYGSEIGQVVNPEAQIWNSVFKVIDNKTENRTGILDPAAQVEKELDLEILEWAANTSKLDKLLGDQPLVQWATPEDQIRTALRKLYLEGKKEEKIRTAIQWTWFSEFLGAYTFLNEDEDELSEASKKLRDSATEMDETLREALKGWSGEVTDGERIEFVDGIKTPEYRFLAQWSSPEIDSKKSRQKTSTETMPGQLWFVLEPEGTDSEIPVPITFELYILMKRIREGYSPNVRDLEKSEGIRLIHSRLSEFTDKQKSVQVVDKIGDELLRLEKGAFGETLVEGGRK